MLVAVKDPIQRFSSRVEDYQRYRPGYPLEVIDLLRNDCGLKPESILADIGSGTGIFTRLLLESGNQVFAVEPNLKMRRAAEQVLSEFPNFTSVVGTAEATTLAPSSVDIVTAAQAAHWFELDKAHREFIRILKPGGWTVLLWNERRTDSTPFLRNYEQLLLTYGMDYQQVRHERISQRIDQFFGRSFQAKVFENRQEFDFESLRGRLLSSSYTPQAEDPNYTAMLQKLRGLFDRHQLNGTVIMEYDTQVYYSQLA
jgi:ubiquinone/menaquinone biosynthesis C-methylase UbiE